MCCTSLRGAAYFGASIHITLGAVLFIRYVIITAFLTFFNVTDVIKDRITGYLLPFVAYITLFLAFGIVIFHSVEKEYFMILKWATLGFASLQVLVLGPLFILRFIPFYEYHQFPFLPPSITDGYVHTGFHYPFRPNQYPHGVTLDSSDEVAEYLPKFTRDPNLFPTSSTGGGGRSREISGEGRNGEDDEEEDYDRLPPPAPTPPPKIGLGRLYSLIALVAMSVITAVYLALLYIYHRQLIYEDSGHVFGHAQSVTRNIAFYVQPQFNQAGPGGGLGSVGIGIGPGVGNPVGGTNFDNKLTDSPSLRSKFTHSGTPTQTLPNSQPSLSNTQIPTDFLPQQQPGGTLQRQNQLTANNLKPCIVGGNHLDQSASTQQANHIPQRSPVPPAREMQQNIQNQSQQQVITIYPQKGGGFTSSSSSPRMQVKFAKPLEQQQPSPGDFHHEPNINYGELPPEPARSCLANPTGSAQQYSASPPQQSMMPPPPPPRLASRNHPPPQLHHQPSSYPQQYRRGPQQYNEMDNSPSSYLHYSSSSSSTNPISNPPPHHASVSSSTSSTAPHHTYPHYSQRRPSGSMV